MHCRRSLCRPSYAQTRQARVAPTKEGVRCALNAGTCIMTALDWLAPHATNVTASLFHPRDRGTPRGHLRRTEVPGRRLDSIARLATRRASRHCALAEDLQVSTSTTPGRSMSIARAARTERSTELRGPTIVDPHLHGLPIRRVLHTHHRIERQNLDAPQSSPRTYRRLHRWPCVCHDRAPRNMTRDLRARWHGQRDSHERGETRALVLPLHAASSTSMQRHTVHRYTRR